MFRFVSLRSRRTQGGTGKLVFQYARNLEWNVELPGRVERSSSFPKDVKESGQDTVDGQFFRQRTN